MTDSEIMSSDDDAAALVVKDVGGVGDASPVMLHWIYIAVRVYSIAWRRQGTLTRTNQNPIDIGKRKLTVRIHGDLVL